MATLDSDDTPMVCPECGEQTFRTVSETNEPDVTRRVRRCSACECEGETEERFVARDWTVIDRGEVPEEGAGVVLFTCLECMTESNLPILGTPMAQVEQGIVFDIGAHAMPKIIECPSCNNRLISEAA